MSETMEETVRRGLSQGACYEACRAINPQSPVTVAENIGELWAACERYEHHWGPDGDLGTSSLDHAKEISAIVRKIREAQP